MAVTRMTGLRSRGTVLLTVAAAAVAGCGGDQEGDRPAPVHPHGPAKERYIAHVDRICERTKATGGDYGRKLARVEKVFSEDARQGLARAAKTLPDTERAAAERLSRIRTTPLPTGPARTGAREYVAALEEDFLVLRDLRGAAERREIPRFAMRAAELKSRARETKCIAEAYGFRDCGGDS
jgi:hypothetical protein